MGKTARIVCGAVLGWAVVAAAGCGGKKDAPPEAKLDDNKGGPATTTAAGTTPDNTAPPVSPAVGWEMDVGKHQIPATPAAGKLNGVTFAPAAQIQGGVLSFQVLKDMVPEREVIVALSPAQAKAVEGLKLTVKPDQPTGADVPVVTVQYPDPKPGAKFPLRVEYPSGYALTLELGKKADRKLPGKIYLSLIGDEKHFLAGTFTADWVRSPTLPPEPDEAPYIHGSVSAVNTPGAIVRVGYFGIDKDGAANGDMIGISLEQPGVSVRSDGNKPRVSTIASGEGGMKPGRYDHTFLAPGRYFVFATAGMSGPAVWQWMTVGPDTKAVVNLQVDGSKAGKVEVALPPGVKSSVSLVPPADPMNPLPEASIIPLAFGLGLHADDAPNGKATFHHVSPGKYQVVAGALTGTVEVEVGKTARVELTLAKK